MNPQRYSPASTRRNSAPSFFRSRTNDSGSSGPNLVLARRMPARTPLTASPQAGSLAGSRTVSLTGLDARATVQASSVTGEPDEWRAVIVYSPGVANRLAGGS